MILRTHFTLLCLATGCLMADAFYLKFKPPRSKASAIKAIQSEAGKLRYPRHIDHITQWLRNKGRKQLVVLDRKDKRVQEFINQLIDLIEQSQLSGQEKAKKHCHKTFGSIYDARNKKVICERYISGEQAQVKPRINVVIPISRHRDAIAGYPEDRGKASDFENEDTTKYMIRRKSNFQFRKYSSSDSSDSDEGRGKMPTRFEIVKNQRDKRMHGDNNAKRLRKKLKNPIESEPDSADSEDSDSDAKDKVWGVDEKSTEDSDSDDNKGEENSDSQEYTTPVASAKKQKRKESLEEDSNYVKQKRKESLEEKSKYVYMQGSRMVDTSRRLHRDPNHFMSKRYQWNSEELNHLGYYWFEGSQGRNPKAK